MLFTITLSAVLASSLGSASTTIKFNNKIQIDTFSFSLTSSADVSEFRTGNTSAGNKLVSGAKKPGLVTFTMGLTKNYSELWDLFFTGTQTDGSAVIYNETNEVVSTLIFKNVVIKEMHVDEVKPETGNAVTQFATISFAFSDVVRPNMLKG